MVNLYSYRKQQLKGLIETELQSLTYETEMDKKLKDIRKLMNSIKNDSKKNIKLRTYQTYSKNMPKIGTSQILDKSNTIISNAKSSKKSASANKKFVHN